MAHGFEQEKIARSRELRCLVFANDDQLVGHLCCKVLAEALACYLTDGSVAFFAFLDTTKAFSS